MKKKPAKTWPKDEAWHDDMVYAFDTAISLLDQEEFSGDNADRQMAAFQDVINRIKGMRSRYIRENI
jgi:hypothetical protein